MKLLVYTLLLAMFFQSSFALADIDSTSFEQAIFDKDNVKYVITYKESQHWVSQVFESPDDEPQRLLEEFNTSSRAEALALHNKLLAQYGYVKPTDDGLADLAVMSDAPPSSADDRGESLWPISQNWSWDWEVEYARWIEGSVDQDFFAKYKIPTDCADVIISLRWIFARMNGLPVANTLSGSRRMVGHMTILPEWRSLPTANEWYKDQRFLAALAYVQKNTYTRSLGADSYPILISKGLLLPGSFHLEFHESGGHAMIVKSVKVNNKSADIIVMDSTLPVAIRRLGKKSYIFGNQAVRGTGFLRILWPVKDGNTWYFAEPEEHPGYSEQQYRPEFMYGQGLFSSAVKSSLSGNFALDMKEWNRALKFIETSVKIRANAVFEGFYGCQINDCSKGTVAYEEFSTPNRDSRLKSLFEAVLRAVEFNKTDRSAMKAWNSFLRTKFAYDKPQNGKARVMTYGEIISTFVNGTYNSEPDQPIDVRWGL